MAGGRSHTILRQVIDLQCRDATVGREMLERVEAMYATEVLPAIEAVFDAFSVDGVDIEIDRLEIDLGALDAEGFVAGLPPLVGAALRRRLQEILTGPVLGEGVERKPVQQTDAEALVEFLETGHARWWAEDAVFSPWELLRRVAGDQPEWLRGYFLGLAGSAVLARVAARIAGAGADWVMGLVLELLVGKVESGAVAQILEILIGNLAGLDATAGWRLRAGLVEAAVGAPGGGEGLLVRWRAGNGLGEVWERVAASETVVAALPSALVSAAVGLELGGGSLLSMDLKVENLSGKSAGEAVYVPNAGLVLVAGFLPGYFGHLGLLSGDRFVVAAAQQRAVQMTEVLVRGLDIVDEHRLGLTKVVCGLSVDAAVDLRVPPTAEDLAAADELLQAVIGYWPVVGDIVPDQLRGGFLLREGWLVKGNVDWTLRVERKTYDVVLEQLPWGIGVVALPWMKWKIWVEW